MTNSDHSPETVPTPGDIQFASDDMLGFHAGERFLFVCPACGHGSEVTATALMVAKGGGANVNDVLAEVTCSNCGRRGAPNVSAQSAAPSPSPMQNKAS